ncbi:MAG: cbb3-type cytochrome oxidase assembly protein CcoS [Oligoflexia bacterium]|nr:cbb3-type cytochrome oxidase assembly protein CcoS [Oligoflexia bacterium]
MSVITVMLPLALLLGFGFTAAFIWMAAKGQYDDLETPAYRLLLEEEPAETGSQRKA